MSLINSIIFNPHNDEDLSPLKTHSLLADKFSFIIEDNSEKLLKNIEDQSIQLIILNIKNLDLSECTIDLIDKVLTKKKFYLIVVGESRHRDFFLNHLCYERVSFIKSPARIEEFIFTCNKADFVLRRIDTFLEGLSMYLLEQDFSSDLLLKKVSDFLISTRTDFKLTQAELSHFLGISLRQLQRIEKGDTNMTLEKFFIILKGIARLKDKQKKH